MYSERLNKLINQVCHAWEEQAAEHEAKMRALANSIVSEHEAERFNTQKAFKSALAAKNNEINSLLSECKKLKALLTHIHSENKELQKKLSMANRTIESLRQGMAYDENGMPISKQGFIGSGDDSTVFASDDSLSVGGGGGGMGVGGIGGDYYGGLDDLSGSHSQLGNWSQQPPPNRQQLQQQQQQQQQQPSQSQQSHLFPRGINSPDSDIYGYNPGVGVGGLGLGGGSGGGVGNGVSGSGGGYYPDNESSIRGPPSLSDGRGSGGGIGGLFTSSSSSSSSIPSVSTSSNQHFPSRGVPSHGLVYGGRFVLESAGEDPPGLYPRDEYQVDRSGSYDLTRADRESDEYNQHPVYLDDPSSQIPGQSQSQINAANAAATSKRLSPSAPSFMPNVNKNNGIQLGSVGNSPVTRSNSSSSSSNNNINNNQTTTINNIVASSSSVSSSSSSSILNPSVDFNQNPPPPPGFESYSTSRDPFYEDGQQIITNQIDPSSNSSLSNLGLEVDSSSSITLNDKDNYDGQLSSPPLSLQTNEAGTVSVINQMRLQSKSSKLDAKPLLSPTSTSNSSSSSNNITNNNFNPLPSSSSSSSSSFPPSNLYSEGLQTSFYVGLLNQYWFYLMVSECYYFDISEDVVDCSIMISRIELHR